AAVTSRPSAIRTGTADRESQGRMVGLSTGPRICRNRARRQGLSGGAALDLERAVDERGREGGEPEPALVLDGHRDLSRRLRLLPWHLREDLDRVDEGGADPPRAGVIGPERALPELVGLVVAARLDHAPGELLDRTGHAGAGREQDPGGGRGDHPSHDEPVRGSPRNSGWTAQPSAANSRAARGESWPVSQIPRLATRRSGRWANLAARSVHAT